MKSIFENVDCILTPGTGSQKKMYSELSAFRKVREDHFELLRGSFTKDCSPYCPGSACVAKKIPDNAYKYGTSDLGTTLKHVR